MFDVVRGRARALTRLRPALLISLLAHAVLLAGALFLSRPVPPPAAGTRPIRIVPPRPIAGGVNPGAKPPSYPVQARRPPRVRPPRTVERSPAPEPSPSGTPEGRSGPDEPGGPGSGGQPGGPECATPPCGGEGSEVLSEEVVAAMPVLLSGPEVTLPADVRRAGAEGTMVVRCVITAAGTVEGCEVLKGLPLVEAAVLAALRARHYRPARVEGRPVSVHHNFTVHIRGH